MQAATGSSSWIAIFRIPPAGPILYGQAREGFDVVLARRIGSGNSFARRLASAAYFRVLNAVLGTSFDAGFGNFSVISRKVRTEFLRVRDKHRHYLMILRWLGFRTTSIELPRADRYAGDSSYSLAMLFRFAIDGLFFQTTTLLRWIVYAGFAISVLGNSWRRSSSSTISAEIHTRVGRASASCYCS